MRESLRACCIERARHVAMAAAECAAHPNDAMVQLVQRAMVDGEEFIAIWRARVQAAEKALAEEKSKS